MTEMERREAEMRSIMKIAGIEPPKEEPKPQEKPAKKQTKKKASE